MGFTAPAPGDLALGMVFLPALQRGAAGERARKILEETVAEYDLQKVTWRDVPVNGDTLGGWAQSLRPYIEQMVLPQAGRGGAGRRVRAQTYLVRKRATQRIWAESITNFYMPSLSSKTVVYKGLFMAPQLPVFYTDLNNPDFRTAIAVFHQRYSTNTFPDLGAGTAVPHGVPQRRDQHAGGQPDVDGHSHGGRPGAFGGVG